MIVGYVADNSSLNQPVVLAVALPTPPALVQGNIPNVIPTSAVGGALSADGLQPAVSSIPAALTPGIRDSSSRLPVLAPTHALPVGAKPTAAVVHGIWAAARSAVALNSSGQFVLKTSASPLGSDMIAATYSGDTNFAGSSDTLGMTIDESMVAASLAVHTSASLPTSGINDAAITSLLAEWSQDTLDASGSF